MKENNYSKDFPDYLKHLLEILKESLNYSGSEEERIKKVFLKKLKELNIDITKNNYITDNNFKKFNNKLFYDGQIIVSWAWWIEQNIVGQERLEQIYSPYSLKVLRKLTDEERKPLYFYKYIAESSNFDYMTDALVKKYFHRNEPNKFGLIKKLRQVGFDIEALSKNPYNQDGYLRLLYFLYNFEKSNNIELTLLLKNPTLENEDSRFNILNTHNGK